MSHHETTTITILCLFAALKIIKYFYDVSFLGISFQTWEVYIIYPQVTDNGEMDEWALFKVFLPVRS